MKQQLFALAASFLLSLSLITPALAWSEYSLTVIRWIHQNYIWLCFFYPIC